MRDRKKDRETESEGEEAREAEEGDREIQDFKLLSNVELSNFS